MRIDINDVSKRFDRFTAVEDVTLSVAEALTVLVAVITVVVGDVIVPAAGGVYSPPEVRDPTDGLIDQVTPPMLTRAVS